MLKEEKEMLNKINFHEEIIKNIQNKDCLNTFTFTIKNSSKTLINYYKISIKNEIHALSINAQDKNDENQIYARKFEINELKKLIHPHILNSENISEIFSFLKSLILLGNKAQITMAKQEDKEEHISLIIKIINDENKIVFNLSKSKFDRNSYELEKKSLSETDEHIQGSDLTKIYPQSETKDITNSVSSKEKDKEHKNNISLLGKKRNKENSYSFNENENGNILVNEKGVKSKECEYLNLVKDLYGNPEEKMSQNNPSSEEDSNNGISKENNINDKINSDNDLHSKEENYEIINQNQINNQINLGNNNNQKKLIFAVQKGKYIPNPEQEEKHKFNNFIVIRNGKFPQSFLDNYYQLHERRHRRRGEKVEEDEEEFRVYNVDNPLEENVIRISTPMKLRVKTEYIDLLENDDEEEESPSINLDSISQKNKNEKTSFVFENGLLKSQIIKKKNQIELLIESLENVNNNKNIEEEENESNIISKINLLYQATEDGSSSFMFHEKCDGKKNLLIIIHTDANNIFGGFTKKSFDSKKINKKADRNSFIFNLNKLKVYKGIVGRKDGNYIEPGILSQKKYGPCFLNDAIFTGSNLLGDIGHVGENQCGYDTKTDYEINNGDKFFKAKEIEIYQIIFNDLIFLD